MSDFLLLVAAAYIGGMAAVLSPFLASVVREWWRDWTSDDEAFDREADETISLFQDPAPPTAAEQRMLDRIAKLGPPPPLPASGPGSQPLPMSVVQTDDVVLVPLIRPGKHKGPS